MQSTQETSTGFTQTEVEKGKSYNELKTSIPNKRTRSCMRTMDFESQLQLLDIDRKDPSKSGRTNGISTINGQVQ